MNRRVVPLVVAIVIISLGACSISKLHFVWVDPPELEAPEARSDFGMVSTGSVEATHAAVRILEEGGNAIDAAVAASHVLGVADLDASGLGGMTYMVIRLATGRRTVIDGTSFTPLAVDVDELRRRKEADTLADDPGYTTAAVPTTLAALELARERYGTRSMADLLQPAIELAERGYRLSQIQIFWTERYFDRVMASDYLPYITLEDGRTIGKPGDLHCRPDLASTLRRIAADGVNSFYRGRIADQIEADMIRNGGFLRKTDLAMLRVCEVAPVRSTYRNVEILSLPRPGGGTKLIEALNILETYPSSFLAEHSVDRLTVLIETFRIARADGIRFASGGDPHLPLNDPTLSKEFARGRAQLINPKSMIPSDELLTPSEDECAPIGESTTQVSVVDQFGNAVSMTQSLGRSFGGKAVTPGLGFPYSSFVEGFNFDRPECAGYLHPRSQIQSDMAPTIVLRDGQLMVALGSPGSNRIPPIIATVISNMVDRGMGVRDAVVETRVLYGGVTQKRVQIEIVDPISEADAEIVDGAGYEEVRRTYFPDSPPRDIMLMGCVNAVAYDPETGVYTGVGDPRRHGYALGPRTAVQSPP